MIEAFVDTMAFVISDTQEILSINMTFCCVRSPDANGGLIVLTVVGFYRIQEIVTLGVMGSKEQKCDNQNRKDSGAEIGFTGFHEQNSV